MNLVEFLKRQHEWSRRTFGEGMRTKGLLQHIRKELDEIQAEPCNIEEWIDVAIIALDGAWRAGYSPEEVVAALERKQATNFARRWPSVNEANPDQAIEHIRETEIQRSPEAPGSGSQMEGVT
jgi:hypothetical protein